MGHLCFVEGSIRHAVFGEPNPVEHWRLLFAPGTQPTTDASEYPPFDEVLAKYRELRAGTLQRLDEMGNSGLAIPPKSIPLGFEEVMQTGGQALLLLTLHNMVHYGQIADARRVAGREPLL